jgi:hypothetical protein
VQADIDQLKPLTGPQTTVPSKSKDVATKPGAAPWLIFKYPGFAIAVVPDKLITIELYCTMVLSSMFGRVKNCAILYNCKT